jgi:NAD(P)-dependent dehydrogenase (short-subunit alcohol dehydrogenase family)
MKMEKKRALIIGASRGLGLGLVKEFLARNWSVVGTVRQESGTALHDLIQKSSDQLQVEVLDITDFDQILSLRERLQGQNFDLLFVNAGTGTYEPTITN